MSISAVIITHDLESYLDQCIASVHDVVDEIILVDQPDALNTQAKAAKFPKVKLFSRPFDNYINQKNFANDQATGDYIISLDADEYLSPSLQEFIGTEGYKQAEAIDFRRINFLGLKPIWHGLHGREYKTRIWKKNMATWGGTLPHERLILAENTDIIRSEHPIYHHAWDSPKDMYTKAEKYGTLAAERYAEYSIPSLFFSAIINPLYKFVRGYFFQRGFQDGLAGFYLASAAAYETVLKYSLALKSKWNK